MLGKGQAHVKSETKQRKITHTHTHTSEIQVKVAGPNVVARGYDDGGMTTSFDNTIWRARLEEAGGWVRWRWWERRVGEEGEVAVVGG